METTPGSSYLLIEIVRNADFVFNGTTPRESHWGLKHNTEHTYGVWLHCRETAGTFTPFLVYIHSCRSASVRVKWCRDPGQWIHVCCLHDDMMEVVESRGGGTVPVCKLWGLLKQQASVGCREPRADHRERLMTLSRSPAPPGEGRGGEGRQEKTNSVFLLHLFDNFTYFADSD